MDPISIVASSFAFAGAILSGLEAFKTLYDAGPDLEDLLSELTETKLMLVDIEKALTSHELEEDLPPDRYEATLGAANLYETALIRLKLDDLVGLSQEYTDQWSRHGRALDFISVNIHRLGLDDSSDPAGGLQRNADCTESTSKENKTPSVCSDDTLVAETVSDSQITRMSRSRATHYRRTRCPSWCSCICHKTSSLQTPESLCHALDLLLMGVSGLPIQNIKCNERLCRRQSRPTVKVNYFFPQWILSRAFQFAFRFSDMQDPELVLRMPRVVPDGAPLMFLAVQGNMEEIQSLFAQGSASPSDVAWNTGRTALHYAVNYNHHGRSKFLIESGASPDAEDKKQATCVALSWERIFGRNTESSDMVESWRYLFDDEEYLESRIFPPLHRIVLGLCRDNLERQLERSTSSIVEQDVDGGTALSWAAAKADLKDVDTLLKFGADPNNPSKRGHTSLSWAAQSASRMRKDVVRALLENGAVANWVDSYNRTPLVYATSEFDDPDCLRLLVEGGADVNLRDCHRRTPLGYAARMGRVKNLCYLLSCGADSSIPDHWGYTPLFEAVHQNHDEVLQVLLAKDATLPSAKANGGMSILHVAAVSGDLLTIEILADHGDLTTLSEDLPNDDGDTARDLFARRQSIEKEHRAAFERLLEKAPGGSRSCPQDSSLSDDDFDFAGEDTDTFVDTVEVQAM
ncbi:hypothetical protein ABEF95_011530 [Exophiala dermatitidis]